MRCAWNGCLRGRCWGSARSSGGGGRRSAVHFDGRCHAGAGCDLLVFGLLAVLSVIGAFFIQIGSSVVANLAALFRLSRSATRAAFLAGGRVLAVSLACCLRWPGRQPVQ